MELKEILQSYSEEAIDDLAQDKVDEVSSLRLPREVLLQEVVAALSSLSYVAKVLAPIRPPAFAFLKLLMDAPGHRSPVEGFRDKVLESADDLTRRARDGRGLSRRKQYELYLRMLHAAWEDEGYVDRSEALLLSALRRELGIWMREHLLLEYHPSVRPIWDGPSSYGQVRNALLSKGLVLIHEGDYVLADEVCRQIRSAWEIELEDDDYRRLLAKLTGQQLRQALEAADLPLSGSKEKRIERLVAGLVPPREVLDSLHITEVQDLCRSCGLSPRGHKGERIGALIDHFDAREDLREPDEDEPEAAAQYAEPEPRDLTDEQLLVLLGQLTGDLLYDILEKRDLRRSGPKADRIKRLTACSWSERTLLGDLRNRDLADLCRKLDVPVSGVKAERIDRLVEWAADPTRDLEEADEDSEHVGPGAAREAEQRPSEPSYVAEGANAEGHPAPGGPEEPENLQEIQQAYPDIQKDEAVMLAVLKDARSLTEMELVKAAHHHQLGWTLVKAHMADLLARLRRDGGCPVRLRATGRSNVYEWLGDRTPARRDALDRAPAREVIDALRQGVVPKRHLEMLAVGQDESREFLVQLLDQISQGSSEFRFIRGPYGSGKTFLCSWLRDRALDQDFAVSTIRIGPDQPLSDLPVFYSGLIDGLRVPEKRDASALAEVLEGWLLRLERQACRMEQAAYRGVPAHGATKEAIRSRVKQEVSRLESKDPAFAQAVRAYYVARVDGDHDTAWSALAWLRGSQPLSLKARGKLGVSGHLTAEGVFAWLRALLDVIAGSYLRGLVVFVDELELVRRFPHRTQRERAYETLRQMVDECGENRLKSCFLICTGTEQLFEDERYGIPSYQALSNRVDITRVQAGTTSRRQPIVQLAPLDGERLLLVAKRVREIHGKAYGWPAEQRLSDAALEGVVEAWTTFGEGKVDRIPRPFLRHVVHLLDVCEEQPSVSPEDLMRKPVSERAMAESVLEAVGD